MRRSFVLLALSLCSALCASAQSGWTAQWIGAPWSTPRDGAEADGSKPMPIFRREFTVTGQVTNAMLRIAGLGQFEATLGSQSGVRMVGAPGLHQAWTDYRKTVTFETYDVKALLVPGANVLGVMLGNGMYNVQRTKLPDGHSRYTKFDASFGAPKLIAELRIVYADGHADMIATDTFWKTMRGPVLFTSTFGGEDDDARKLTTGWNQPGAIGEWEPAQIVDGPGGELIPAIAPEMLADGTHPVVRSVHLEHGRVVYDLGQNFSGVVKITARGQAGSTLKLTPGELLSTDGSVSQVSSGAPMWWRYTLSGAKDGEEWQPKFGYYGFRYVQAEWTAEPGNVVSVTGIPWHSASPVTGSFESSNKMLNAIHRLIVEAMHNNEATLMTDCPHREKLGWLEETQLVANGLMFNNNLQGLYTATDRNIADAQRPDGSVPTIAPHYTQFGGIGSAFDDSPEWGSAAVLAPWAAYRFYGDKAQLQRDYPVMQRYVANLAHRAKDGIVSFGLGDWYDIGPGQPGTSKLTSSGVTGTLMLYEDAVAMEKIALLLERDADAATYRALAETEKRAFQAKFFNTEKGTYDRGSQTALAMPLALGIVPESARTHVLQALIADIHSHKDHVTSGEIGYPYLLRALMQSGRGDLVMALMTRKDAPSYGSQLATGATALTEAWDANPKDSQDHFMLGGAEEWFYRGLGGLDLDLSRTTQAERITIRPEVVGGVDWVKTSYASTLGRIGVQWHRVGAVVHLAVEVPVPATIDLPGGQQVVGPGEHHFSFTP
jgi:alpha-L-rhamnosidase